MPSTRRIIPAGKDASIDKMRPRGAAETPASPEAPSTPDASIVAVSKRVSNRTSSRLGRYLSLGDFEEGARRCLPKMIFGYVSGAVETRASMLDAESAYAELALVPNYLVDVSHREQGRTLLGKRYASPFGVSPLGGAAMIAHDGDRVLARAARIANVPMILSASSLTKLEDIHAEYPDAWFQAYLPGDDTRIEAMLKRVAAAGFGTLVITADTPVAGNRENNLRSGFSMPLRITPRVVLDSARHPRWLFGTVARTFFERGVPHFENMDAMQGPPMLSQNFARNMDSRDQLSWRHVELMRRLWKGKLVIKGLLSTHDVAKAREVGAEGIIVSNHGGRQLDYAISPIRVLREIRAEAKGMSVMIDGGIRRGTDLIKALALGADFVFIGRPFLYAAAVGGTDGVLHAMTLLRDEIHRNMALLGLRHLDEVPPGIVKHGVKGAQNE
ncbi:MAG TPA: alpha-hydroxy acid oxidase [Stellaceae bacterium]|nr:alpha-hydroxy acid oxidase [Stellaceae bacterium]